MILKENEILRKNLTGFLDEKNISNRRNGLENLSSLESNSTFLNMLLKSAEKETILDKNRYETKLKLFSAYLFIIGGRSTYKTLCANLPLPSITTVLSSIKVNGNFVIEGEMNFQGLSDFLTKHNLVRCLWMSEDATGITARIQYDQTTNQIVGFVLPLNENGLPNIQIYPATNAGLIKEYFENKTASTLLYVIMMQPLQENAPPFCFSLFGTDNKFTASDVTHRWNFIFEEAKKFNILILGASSDGDTRCLKSMRYHMKLGINNTIIETSSYSCIQKYFASSLEAVVCVQDTIHIATKLRNRLLKTEQPQKELLLGKNKINVRDLHLLIENVPKSQHLLCKSDLNVRDKMNYRTVEKITILKVINLLNERKATSTAIYLEMIKNCISAFTDKHLGPAERICKIWTSAFFFRAWRSFIARTKNYKMTNFISSNAYFCIEINAHAIINILINLRNLDCPQYFLPTLFNSQTCENFFRTMRSMTSTNCTMVNFSMLEVLHRLKRLQLQTDLLYSDELNGFNFPHKKDLNCETLKSLPCDEEIGAAVILAKTHVEEIFRKLGVDLIENDFLPKMERVNQIDKNLKTNTETDLYNDHFDIDSNSDVENIALNENSNPVYTDSDSDCDLPLSVVRNKLIQIENDPHLKLSSEPVDKSKVTVKDGPNEITIKKSTLCWLLQKANCHLSSDRQRRVMGK